ncbi:MAG: NUDIX domain-containing protein [Proteobacteria bacterium]|nr:NUDIX domain-containing protein [Pseudomonadota bacterium]
MTNENKQAKLVTYLLLRKSNKVFLVQYKDSPNPNRKGWWVPAPELAYGEHPEDCAKRILKSVGISESKLMLSGVDSFVTKDWHVLFYYVADVTADPVLGAEYEKGEWFELDNLPEDSAYAHGKWEKDLVLRLAHERKQS